jgi:hypothetical protein
MCLIDDRQVQPSYYLIIFDYMIYLLDKEGVTNDEGKEGGGVLRRREIMTMKRVVMRRRRYIHSSIYINMYIYIYTYLYLYSYMYMCIIYYSLNVRTRTCANPNISDTDRCPLGWHAVSALFHCFVHQI